MGSIQIQSDSKFTENGVTYRTVEMASDNREIRAVVVSGRLTYASVIVKNASHRAWRGMGKQFPTLEAAIDNYKSGDIKTMLRILAEPVAMEAKAPEPEKKIQCYSFDRYEMSKHLTLGELTALRQQIEADPRSQNPRRKTEGSKDIYIHTHAARRKLDNIAWVITWKLKDLRERSGETAGEIATDERPGNS